MNRSLYVIASKMVQTRDVLVLSVFQRLLVTKQVTIPITSTSPSQILGDLVFSSLSPSFSLLPLQDPFPDPRFAKITLSVSSQFSNPLLLQRKPRKSFISYQKSCQYLENPVNDPNQTNSTQSYGYCSYSLYSLDHIFCLSVPCHSILFNQQAFTQLVYSSRFSSLSCVLYYFGQINSWPVYLVFFVMEICDKNRVLYS